MQGAVGQLVPLELLDLMGAEPIDGRDMAYWGCDPFDLIAAIEEELGVPFITLNNVRGDDMT